MRQDLFPRTVTRRLLARNGWIVLVYFRVLGASNDAKHPMSAKGGMWSRRCLYPWSDHMHVALLLSPRRREPLSAAGTGLVYS